VSGRLLRTRDVAEILDVSCETVLRWHRSGKLPGGRRLGSNVLRFDSGEIEAWVEGTRPEPTLVSVTARSYYRGAE
jgi:excisionase family DNA binding protein